MKILADFVSLFFPRYCLACHGSLYRDEENVCLHCWGNVAKTNSYQETDNFIERKFFGKTPILFAHAYLYFQQKGTAQQIIHHIKYENREDLAIETGKRYALELREYLEPFNIDFIIPVPLHFRKKKIRGYNQSMKIGEGMESILSISCIEALKRNKATTTQTRKNRLQRWQNVDNIFELIDERVIGKRVILIDDVITTGATIEACAIELIKNGCEVGVIALAAAK